MVLTAVHQGLTSKMSRGVTKSSFKGFKGSNR